MVARDFVSLAEASVEHSLMSLVIISSALSPGFARTWTDEKSSLFAAASAVPAMALQITLVKRVLCIYLMKYENIIKKIIIGEYVFSAVEIFNQLSACAAHQVFANETAV